MAACSASEVRRAVAVLEAVATSASTDYHTAFDLLLERCRHDLMEFMAYVDTDVHHRLAALRDLLTSLKYDQAIPIETAQPYRELLSFQDAASKKTLEIRRLCAQSSVLATFCPAGGAAMYACEYMRDQCRAIGQDRTAKGHCFRTALFHSGLSG
ncbi:unnamed protein product [Symbiodinium sp. CCMP2592]|nr:unnamed protein product [Symbiodinium sp. CCMP2592]